jgi:hypothetical protein
MEPTQSLTPEKSLPKRLAASSILRIAAAIGIMVAVFFYIRAILVGAIPERQKLGVAELALIFAAVLVVSSLMHPEFIDRLTRFKVGGVEVELEKLQRAQKIQRNELDDLRFVLTLLLRPSELQHLRDLEKGNTKNQVGSHTLRADLRKLRTLGLIRSSEGKKIAGLVDRANADLSQFVELTKRGRDYLERIGDDEDKEDA